MCNTQVNPHRTNAQTFAHPQTETESVFGGMENWQEKASSQLFIEEIEGRSKYITNKGERTIAEIRGNQLTYRHAEAMLSSLYAG